MSVGEEFVPIKGYEDFYLISNHGRVFSLRKHIYLKLGASCHGYLRIGLYDENTISKKFAVHRLVALHFNEGYFEGTHVNHIDRNRKNNRTDNLEWVTAKQNYAHSRKEIKAALTKHNQENYSKFYRFTHPCGKVEISKNLNEFCRKHDLSAGTLWGTTTGRRTHHKGFKAEKITN